VVCDDHALTNQQPSGTAWIRKLPLQNAANLEYNDEWYRSRLRALQSVDELVDGVVKRLEAKGLLQNTFIIYTSGKPIRACRL
jgi:membrane-anchored protein YejM (alkaline phosphatase superfamily)